LRGTNFYEMRTATDPDQALGAIPAAIAELDPNLPIEDLKTMPQQVRDNVFMDRMISTLSAAFAALATLLAAVGLYGVLAYTIALRTREIGLRMALGADARRVRGMVLRQVGWMTLVGGIVGMRRRSRSCAQVALVRAAGLRPRRDRRVGGAARAGGARRGFIRRSARRGWIRCARCGGGPVFRPGLRVRVGGYGNTRTNPCMSSFTKCGRMPQITRYRRLGE
jgi:hypothetical protein